ncbi:MAG: GNAT family N-acetyltransferase [Coriobacteriia bacterium]|nr:GNAT family N-acetyltransferase [Coriobacteriia bacterium]MCL2537220.1 GNAT family N-acetyltransferase [Coriobacteriia bacterium]
MTLTAQTVSKTFPDLPQVKHLLETQFPKDEQIPLRLLLARAKKDNVYFKAYYDAQQLIGFVYYIVWQDMTYGLFLAVDPSAQSKGYGAQILQSIRTLYPDNRFVLNIETLDEHASNYEQRIRRRAFYLRLGAEPTGFIVREAGVDYECLTIGGSISAEEFKAITRQFYGPLLYLFAKPKIRPAE